MKTTFLQKMAVVFGCVALLSVTGITLQAQTVIYYLGSDTETYDQVLIESVTGDCYVEPRPGVSDHLPIDSTVASPKSAASVKLSWITSTNGSWTASIRRPGYEIIDATAYDSLSFYLYAPDSFDIIDLPYIRFQVRDNEGHDIDTDTLPLARYVKNMPAKQWIIVSIPITDFINAPGNPSDIDFTQLRQLRFGRGEQDNVQHTINMDDIRLKKQLIAPVITKAQGWGAHVELFIQPAEAKGTQNNLYRSDDGGLTYTMVESLDVNDSIYEDWTGKTDTARVYSYKIVAVDTNDDDINSDPSATVSATVQPLTDDELMEMLTQSTFRFYRDYSWPESGLMPQSLIRYGWDEANVGNTAYMIMAYIIGAERGYVSRDDAITRLNTTCNTFIQIRENGAIGVFDSYLNSDGTGMARKSAWGDGGMLAAAIICARQYFNQNNSQEEELRNQLTQVYEDMDWNLHVNPADGVTYWTAYMDGDTLKFQDLARSFTELFDGYYAGAGSYKNQLPGDNYQTSWIGQGTLNFPCRKPNYDRGEYLDVLNGSGSALYILQYNFLV